MNQRRRHPEPLDVLQGCGGQLTCHEHLNYLERHVLGVPHYLRSGVDPCPDQTGHGVGKPTKMRIQEATDIWAFLVHVLDMDGIE